MLEVLDLSDNNLGMIEGHILGPAPNLTELDLSGNSLKKFPVEILSKAPLKIINLTRNKIPAFNPEFIPKIQNGSRILLNQNQLKCDCRLILLTRFFNEFRPKLSNFSKEFYNDYLNFECGVGSGVKHLISLEESDLICDTTEDPFAPKVQTNYDLEIRTLEQKGSAVELRWRVRSKEDVAGFKISAYDDGNSEVWKKMYSYDTRSAEFSVPENIVQICLNSKYSRAGSTEIDSPKTCQNIDPIVTSGSVCHKILHGIYAIIFQIVLTTCFITI